MQHKFQSRKKIGNLGFIAKNLNEILNEFI